MLHVLNCITEQHDLRLVVLAGILCLFACVTAMNLIARARVAEPAAQAGWLLAGGVVAGCGIWGTHFVAMLAYQAGFPVAYNPSLTILSVVIAVCLCAAGFALALSRPGPVIGGAVTGTAIGAMHYVGMAAVVAPAVAVWDWRYVAASAVLGIAAMAFGLRVVVRGHGWRSRAWGAVIFTLAICSMHFTGMSAVTYRFDPRVTIPNIVVEPATLAIAVAAIAILIVALGLVGALVDSHLTERSVEEANRLRAHIVELEATQHRLEQTTESLMLAVDAADAAGKAKSAFLAAMSHELRTPLNAIIGFSDVLGSEMFGTLGPRNKDYAGDIHTSGVRLLALINDVLDLARIDAGQNQLAEEIVDLDGVIRDCAQMLSQQAEAGNIRISQHIDPDARLVKGDERRLRRVMLNLIGNAVKFTNPGGEVEIRGRCDVAHLTVSVRDTGIGMAQKDIPVALERFGQIDSTLARKYEGTGLGLPLAKQLVELHGGVLAIQSEPLVGTLVTVTLPASRILPAPAIAAA